MSRFGCPRKIVTDNAKAFTSTKLVKFYSDYTIILSHSTAYYPQGNGLAKSSNKSLVRIIKKFVDGGKNPLQQRGSLPIPQVPIRLMNVWYDRLDGDMDLLPF